MSRCRSCILPDSYDGVTFDDDGVCDLCRDHANAAERESSERQSRMQQLDGIVDAARREDGEYDCVVPVSGGRDSSYVAYIMRRRFGLRVLGVNYDNGYRSPLALANLDALSDRLHMSLVTLRPQPDLVRRIFAHFFRLCGYFCGACDAIGYIVIGSFLAREAARTGHRPLVVGGWSKKYEYQPGLSVLSMEHFGAALSRDPALFEELRRSPLIEERVFDVFVSARDIRQELPRGADSGADERTVPRLIQLPDYVEWDYAEIDTTLKQELGWQEPGRGHGAHFDCLLSSIPEYLKNRKFGLSQETIRNSVLVREGVMTREEALQKRELEQVSEPELLRDVLSRWGMTMEDVAWDAAWSR